MTDMDYARLGAALSLREIAAFYLNSAKEAGNPTVWGAHLRLAAKLEKEAAALEAVSNLNLVPRRGREGLESGAPGDRQRADGASPLR
jgi:hypothetical protein